MSRIICLFLLLLNAGLVDAAVAPSGSAVYQGSNPEVFGAVPVGNSHSITRTISRNPISTMSYATQIAVAASGPGYTLTGGTCLGNPALYPPSDTCTVTMTLAPAAPGAAVGNLAINCILVGLVGGLTVNCGTAAPITTNVALQGSGTGAAAVLPSVGTWGLSLLALMLFGMALRSLRPRSQN